MGFETCLAWVVDVQVSRAIWFWLLCFVDRHHLPLAVVAVNGSWQRMEEDHQQVLDQVYSSFVEVEDDTVVAAVAVAGICSHEIVFHQYYGFVVVGGDEVVVAVVA
jgi:hypothetical protein